MGGPLVAVWGLRGAPLVVHLHEHRHVVDVGGHPEGRGQGVDPLSGLAIPVRRHMLSLPLWDIPVR